ncbi:hypothetical protein Tco_1071514 [Tanacetum coccineum]
MQQPIQNPNEITYPITAMNMALVLMAKAFKLNYSTPTNNNQRISANPHNRQIAQPGMNMVQDKQMQMVGGQITGNQNGYNVVQNAGNHNANQNGNGNVVAAQAKGNGNGNNGDIKEIEEVNVNCILMANLKQAYSSGTQAGKAPVYDSYGSAENDSYVIPADSNIEHSGGIVEQYPATVEETRVFFESLYNNLVIGVEKVNMVNRKMKDANNELTTELARYKGQEKCFKSSKI